MSNIIEIYPRPKSCDAGCAHCHLKFQSDNIYNKLDPRVGETFEKLQTVMDTHKIKMYLTYTYPISQNLIEPLPIINASLVENLALAAGDFTDNHDSIDDIFNKVDFMLSSITNTKETILNTKLVYRHKTGLLLDNQKGYIIDLFTKYKQFSLEKGLGDYNIGVETNMISYKNFKKNISSYIQEGRDYEDKIYDNLDLDTQYLGNLKHLYHTKTDIFERFHSQIIFDWQLKTKDDYRKGRLNKRVMSSKQSINKNIDNIELNDDMFKLAFEVCKDFAPAASIHPHGVMINHSTFDIYNPFLRVTHEDFRNFLNNPEICQKGVDGKPSLDFRSLVKNNLAAYCQNQRLTDKQLILMSIFK